MVSYGRKRSAVVRRRTVKRRRVTRRVPRIPRTLVTNNVMMCKRKHYFGNIDILQTSWTTQTFQFRLDNLPQHTDFTNLFDEYKINAVKIDFVPGATSNDQEGIYQQTGAGGTYMFTPQVFTLIDKDGLAQINTQTQTLENSNARLIKNPFQPFSVYVRKPMALMSAGGVTASILTRGWTDCSTPGVIHHGASIAGQILGGSTTAALRYYVTLTYYLAFRKAK